MAPKALSEKQRTAAAYVALGHTDQEIADTTGVAKSTVAAWRKRSDFQREVNKCVGEAQRMILRRGVGHGAAADEYLRSVMDSDDPRISTPQKIDAAKALQKRLPAITPDSVTEPVPDAPALPVRPVGPDGLPEPVRPAEETLLEMYKVMAEIEHARTRQRQPLVIDSHDDEDDENDDEDEPRVIVGELADDDGPEDKPQTPLRPVGNHRARQTPTPQAEVERMLRGRGAARGRAEFFGT